MLTFFLIHLQEEFVVGNEAQSSPWTHGKVVKGYRKQRGGMMLIESKKMMVSQAESAHSGLTRSPMVHGP